MKFIPVDYDYFDFQGKNYVRIIGRDESGKKVCVIDSYEPNFWIILRDGEKETANKVKVRLSKIKVEKAGRTSKVLRTELKDKKYLGGDVKALQVFVTNHKDIHELTSEIGDMDEIVFRREYDIPLITKYIKEKGIEPLRWYSVKSRELALEDFGGIVDSLEVENCVFAESMEQIEGKEFEPKILAYDIETDGIEVGKGEILMVSLYGKDFKIA